MSKSASKSASKKSDVKASSKAKISAKKSKQVGAITPVELNEHDAHYLKLALKEAKRGRYTTSPNPAVGCVIVRDDKILGQGFHHAAGQPHAEVMALRDADQDVAGATVYVTLEPCCHYGRTPPCALALIEAKVARVVIGSRDPNPKVAGGGIAMLQEAGIDVTLAADKLNERCLKLNRAFFKSITTKRPFVITKLGMSMDGKIALSDGSSKWITNEDSRSDGQRLRLWSDVLITTAATVRVDNPRYNVRIDELPAEVMTGLDTALITQPPKVVIDTQATLCQGYDDKLLRPFSIFSQGESFIAVGTQHDLGAIYEAWSASQAAGTKLKLPEEQPTRGWVVTPERIVAAGPNFVLERFTERVSILALPQVGDHVSLEALLDFLGSKEMRVAMVEAGAALTSAFLNQGLVDECYCYLAPMFLGASAQSGLQLPEPPTLKDAQRFARMDCKVIGDNVLVVLSDPIKPKAKSKSKAKVPAKTTAPAAASTTKAATKAAAKAATKSAAKTDTKSATMAKRAAATKATKSAAKATKSAKSAPSAAPQSEAPAAEPKATKSATKAAPKSAAKRTKASAAAASALAPAQAGAQTKNAAKAKASDPKSSKKAAAAKGAKAAAPAAEPKAAQPEAQTAALATAKGRARRKSAARTAAPAADDADGRS